MLYELGHQLKIRFLLFFLVSMLCFFTNHSAFSYPYLIDFKNSPQVITNDKSIFVLKKLNQLVVPGFVVTARFDEITWVLPNDYQIRVAANSKIEFPNVFESESKEHTIHLLSGEVRLKSDLAKKQSPLHIIKTAFFELPVPQQSDVIIKVDSREPSVTIQIISGEWSLEFFAYEKKVKLHSGQMVKFKGQLAEDQSSIRFDYLLDQRKIPKGSLGAIEKFDVKNFLEVERKAEVEIQKKHNTLMKQKAEEARRKKAYEDSFLCKKPLAQVNQCAWYLENKNCFRKRCNVSGQWGDITERPLSALCTDEFLVGACDY